MEIISEKIENGIAERRFDLVVDGEVVPGIHWLPEGEPAVGATILIGHGGTQHKRVPNVVALARKLVTERGYGAVSLDAPRHGDRMTDRDREAQRAYRASRRDGAPPLDPMRIDRLRLMREAAPQVVKEWKALLDHLEGGDRSSGRFGYWGVSMGTSYGIPLLVNDSRIEAAVLGLNALRDGDDRAKANAAKITIPILFLFQWHDELIRREAGLALWHAFGSAEKTMHINPGGHVGIPRFESDAAVSFFTRHLSSVPEA